MAVPLHSRIRRKLRTLLNFILAKLLTPKESRSKIDPQKIRKVLLIRINYRIGNIIFMTPLIRSLEQRLPHAKIDLLTGAPFTAPVIEPMPNIDHVYPTPRSLLKRPLAFYRFIQKLNRNRYDLIINPVAGSVSANIATMLIKAPLKLGYRKPDTWSPFNVTLPFPADVQHEALKPLGLLKIFEGAKQRPLTHLDIALSAVEREEGAKLLHEKITAAPHERVIGLFRDARNEKRIDDAWWRDFVKSMENIDRRIRFIDILPPHEKEALLENMPSVASKNLRNLAKIFSALDAFVCGDTGPMHLASASLTPTVALFNATDPSCYGPLGKKDSAIDINAKSAEDAAQEVYNHLKQILF